MARVVRTLAPAALLTFVVACATLNRPVTVDPDASFAAHQEHGGLAIDRLEHGRTARLRPAGWLRLPGAPTYELESGGETIAALWLSGSHVVVRRAASASAPLLGEVIPSWDEGAIRLALQAAGGPAFRTDRFVRQQPGGGPGALTRAAQSVIDVRGTYEGTLRDARGVAMGFVRARVGPYQPAPRIYDGAVPAGITPALAVAAAAALEAEIDWIEDHALNVYRGNSGGHLEQSIPLPR
jgi:hypothetical protein